MKQIASLWLTWSLLSGSALAQNWGPVIQISTNSNGRSTLSPNNARCIASDDSGRVYVVWAFWSPNISDRGIYFRRSADGGLTWEPERKLTDYTPMTRMPAVDADKLGGVRIVWSDQRDGSDEIYFKRSTDSGNTWGQDTRLTFRLAGKEYPVVATGVGGRVHLAWDGQLFPSEAIYYKRSTDGGNTWGAETTLTGLPEYALWPSLAIGEPGKLHLTWEGKPGGIFDSSGVFYRRSTDSGVTWDTVRQLNTSLFQAHSPSVSADSQGFVYCAWMDTRNRRGETYFRRSSDGGTSWDSEVTLATAPGYDYVGPSVTQGSRGEVGAGYFWLTSGQRLIGVSYRHSTDRGMTWGPEELVSDTIAHWVGSVSTAMDSFGSVHVAWSDSTASLGYWAVFYRRRNAGVGVADNAVPSPVSRFPFPVRPNPFTTFATLPGHEAERFVLYDISGRKVGTYRGDRVGDGLGAGVYFLKPEGKDAKPLRIIKLR